MAGAGLVVLVVGVRLPEHAEHRAVAHEAAGRTA
jgi:hypothetical protein